MLGKRDDISGIKIGDQNIKMLQLADDTTIFTSNLKDIGRILRLLKAFYKISGLKVNIEKTIAYLIGKAKPPNTNEPTFGLDWKTLPIKLLGITITNDIDESYTENFESKIKSIENLIHIWSTRNLTIKGKVTVINTLLIPKLVYPCTILHTPDKVIQKVDKLFKDYIWNWKTPKIRFDCLVRKAQQGGIKLPCFKCKVDAWRMIWAIRALKYETKRPLWAHIASQQLTNGLTLEYLFKSRPTEEILRLNCNKLDNFYKKIIVQWTKIKSNETLTTKDQINNECIWLNSKIAVKNVSLNMVSNITLGIRVIKDLITVEKEFKDLNDINRQYNASLSFLDYFNIRQTIPFNWKRILRGETKEDKSTDIQYNKLRRVGTMKSRDLYWTILQSHHDLNKKPAGQIQWESRYNLSEDDMRNYYTIPYLSIRSTQVQSLQFKILHRIFNCNYWLHKIKIKDNPTCRFCTELETISHFFFACEFTKQFWNAFINWWNRQLVIEVDILYEKDIVLGVPITIHGEKLLNCCILLAKNMIAENKSFNKQPDMYIYFVLYVLNTITQTDAIMYYICQIERK
jgi:hypothetical protein